MQTTLPDSLVAFETGPCGRTVLVEPEQAPGLDRRVFLYTPVGSIEWAHLSDFRANGARARFYGFASKELPATLGLRVHAFDSSGEAYDACQCRDDIRNGDLLLIASEGVVGVADTWPLAVTTASGHLHEPAEGFTLTDCLKGRQAIAGVENAKRLAGMLGYEVRS